MEEFNKKAPTNICDTAIRQAREGCVEEQEPSLRIRQCFNGLVSLPMRTLETINILLRPAVSNLPFMGSQPPRCRRAVWKKENQCDRPSKGNETKYDEQPPPRSNLIINLANCIRQQPAKDARQSIASEPDAMPQRML
jgi:hypothetical protein